MTERPMLRSETQTVVLSGDINIFLLTGEQTAKARTAPSLTGALSLGATTGTTKTPRGIADPPEAKKVKIG